MISNTENNDSVPIFTDIEENELKQAGDFKSGKRESHVTYQYGIVDYIWITHRPSLK